MAPTTQKTAQRFLQASLLLALLIAAAGIGHSQTASPCLSSQLSAHREGGDASMGGRRSEYFSFRNDSRSTCTLKGTPGVALFDGGGRRMNVLVGKDKETEPPKAVTLEPGGKAFFGFDYTSCAGQNQAVERKSRCMSSTELGFTPPGTTSMVMIRESIDGEITGLSSFVSTLKEFGYENTDGSKPPEPKPYNGNGKRLYFKPGAVSLRAQGSLNSENDAASYLLDVKPHQRIYVRSCGGVLLTASNIYDPVGKEVSDDRDQDGNNGVTDTAAEGTYRIEVLVGRDSGEKKGPFCIEITVVNPRR